MQKIATVKQAASMKNTAVERQILCSSVNWLLKGVASEIEWSHNSNDLGSSVVGRERFELSTTCIDHQHNVCQAGILTRLGDRPGYSRSILVPGNKAYEGPNNHIQSEGL